MYAMLCHIVDAAQQAVSCVCHNRALAFASSLLVAFGFMANGQLGLPDNMKLMPRCFRIVCYHPDQETYEDLRAMQSMPSCPVALLHDCN